VAGCGKFDLHKSTPDWGLDGQRCLSEWGFSAGIDNAGKWDAVISGAETPTDPYMAYLHEDGLAEAHVADMRRRRDEGAFRATFPTPLPEDSYCDNWIARNGLSLLADAPPDRPWHLVVNFAGPHDPMDVTERMHDWYRTPDVEFPSPTNRGDRLSIEEHAAVRRNYSAMIENVDRWVGRYLETLERRGELHNTVVVFTSDHGEMLGDQGEWRKRSPYHPSVAVPLVVAGPGVASQRPSDALVNVYDLFATLLDIADVDVPDGVDSRSFADVLQGDTDTHRPVLRTALGDWEAVYDGTYKLVSGYAPLCENGERTLVTPERDETVDVSDAAPDVRARLTDVIDRDPLVSSPTA
jgi:arylsulfatase A-like enzyme